ncbi:MAG: hypothetical protein ACI311_06560 [Bacilli bacterium]
MFNQQQYINEYIKEKYRTIKLRVRNDDVILINKLSNVHNINKYILDLIRQDILENREYKYIDNDIEIDFTLSNTMDDLVKKAEEADLLEDYGLYMNIADAIDVQAKKEVTNHIITETEWKKICRRYHL